MTESEIRSKTVDLLAEYKSADADGRVSVYQKLIRLMNYIRIETIENFTDKLVDLGPDNYPEIKYRMIKALEEYE